jgi:hypothetical protein
MRIAVQRAHQLLLSPGFHMMAQFVPKRIILVSQDATRQMEEIVAVELLRNFLDEMGASVNQEGPPDSDTLKVIVTAEPHEVIQAISRLPCRDSVARERLADFIVGFGVVNDYAEYLGLDSE